MIAQHGWSPALRTRVFLAFGVLSSLLATALALVAWLLVSTFLLNQREASAVRLASGQAATADAALQQQRPPEVPQLLDALDTAPGSRIVLRYEGQWYGGLANDGEPTIPTALTQLVESGTAGTQRVGSGEEQLLIVGIPLPRSGGAFFELFSLRELSRTLELFSVSLVVAVVLLAAVNTFVGWYASRVAIRPLERLTAVASTVAAGDLDARMSEERDPDLRSLARSFNSTVDALEQRVAADARFAGDVSHELRTPLTTMVNSMELLQNRRRELPASALEPLDLLADDLDRFRRLVLDLIEISRHDSGVPGDFEPVDVADLVRQAADTAAGREVTHIEPGAEGVRTRADKRRLERVFANLVENAERHGGGCRAVTVHHEGDQVTVTVDDAGKGVPAERRQRIFERFARDSGAGGSAGVGLGLAIVERHVHTHGGTVVVQDRPGGGARFVVSLPIRRSSET